MNFPVYLLGVCLLLSAIFIAEYFIAEFCVMHIMRSLRAPRPTQADADATALGELVEAQAVVNVEIVAQNVVPENAQAEDEVVEMDDEEPVPTGARYVFHREFRGKYLRVRGQKFMRKPYEILQGIEKSAEADLKKQWNEACYNCFQKGEFDGPVFGRFK
jgi:hypothetical protein